MYAKQLRQYVLEKMVCLVAQLNETQINSIDLAVSAAAIVESFLKV